MKIGLSEHFGYKKLLRFVLPSIVMMIFTSIYSVVDGLFVSNYVGKTPFAAVNLIMPLLIALGSVGFMMGTGGSAIVSKTLGEGKNDKANEYFSMIVYATVVLGIAISVIGFIFLPSIAVKMGANGELLKYCTLYGRILIVTTAAFMLQNVFQSFFVAAEKPQIGLMMSVAAGVTNMLFDFLFIVVFHWGLAGAAVATAISQAVGGIVPFFYFILKKDSLLRLTKARFEPRILLKTCTNGSSELMTNISSSLVNMLYNIQLIKIAGENGVAAYGVIMYVNFIFAAVFIGYSIGSAPIIGYHYGAANHGELKNLFKKSIAIISCGAAVMTLSAELMASPLSSIFVGYDKELMEMTANGFRIYSLSFLISGFNIFGSAFFTALSNGGVSAAISFLRTLVFQITMVLVLPTFLGLNGIWFSISAAELLAVCVTVFFLVKNKEKYHYV